LRSKSFYIFIALIVLINTSCAFFNSPNFEQEYYERSSGITFPKKFHIIESYDNGEFVTTTTLNVDSVDLVNFLKKYKFEKREKIYPAQFMGTHTLKKTKPDFNNLENLYFLDGSKGKNSWLYIIDINQKILWAEIQYPDWGGT
jgi:hypothetical protein